MGKPFPPADEVAIAELVKALAAACESDEHVTRTVDEILRIPGAFPEIAEFLRVADSLRTMAVQPDKNCGACGGAGYRSTARGGEWVEVKCLCRGGATREVVPGLWAFGGESCGVCGGAGTFKTLRGAIYDAAKCDCWALRPKPREEIYA